jgi:hypothetical protein
MVVDSPGPYDEQHMIMLQSDGAMALMLRVAEDRDFHQISLNRTG